jgi:hypothetical protein
MKSLFARWLTAAAVAAAATSTAYAEQRPTYAVKVEASRAGEQVLVSATITETLADGKTTRTISQPRLLILDGQRGEIVIGQPADRRAAPAPPAPPPAPFPGPAHEEVQPAPGAPRRAPAGAEGDIQSGIRMDVISIKGEDKVLVITVVIRDGATVWAEAVTSKTTVKPKDQVK